MVVLSANNFQCVLPASWQAKVDDGVRVALHRESLALCVQEFQLVSPPGSGPSISPEDWDECIQMLDMHHGSISEWLMDPAQVGSLLRFDLALKLFQACD